MKLKFFELAKKVSKLSDHHQHKLGAVIAKGNKLVSVGHNKLKTSPRSSHPHFSVHAEMSAILSTREDLTGSIIYVYRQQRDGTLANAKPCQYCFSMIEESGIKTIYYTDNNEYKEYKI